MKRLINYLHGVKIEMSRVKWPGKADLFKSSLATIAFIIFFAMLFYGIDIVVSFVRGLV